MYKWLNYYWFITVYRLCIFIYTHACIYVRIYVEALAMWSSSNNNLSGGSIKNIGNTQWSPDVCIYIFKIHGVVLPRAFLT